MNGDYGAALLIQHLRSTAKMTGIPSNAYFQLCQSWISGYQTGILPVSTPQSQAAAEMLRFLQMKCFTATVNEAMVLPLGFFLSLSVP